MNEKASPQTLLAIEITFCQRAAAQGYKHGTMTRNKAELEFFAGACAALGYVPARWGARMLAQRPVITREEEKEILAATAEDRV